MAQQYTLSRRAIMKMILHAAKYPHRAVNGVIIGTVASDRSVEMVDAVPLFHSHLALAPMLETALFQAGPQTRGLLLALGTGGGVA